MRKALLLLLSTLFLAGSLLADDTKSTVTVKNSESVTGVIIVTAVQLVPESGKRVSIELQCNKGVTGCTAPAPGDYVMVRLPKNWGVYDCANIDLYPQGSDPKSAEKIGEYCITVK